MTIGGNIVGPSVAITRSTTNGISVRHLTTTEQTPRVDNDFGYNSAPVSVPLPRSPARGAAVSFWPPDAVSSSPQAPPPLPFAREPSPRPTVVPAPVAKVALCATLRDHQLHLQ
ncbi:hypothetical protein K438DRAFT_1981542 [Mycena galopus ATCC 62051]|nr:hypothetical protein K438DRAFT_1981542 [Mycena galopus ATCC 62051]